MLSNAVPPLVSVVIPAYNRAGYLQAALASAAMQTYRNTEIIVCDDASIQDPWPLIRQHADPRVRYFRQVRNVGMFQNTRDALAQATGTYVAVLNDDDVWEPQFLQTLVDVLETHPDVVLAFCDCSIIDADGALNPAATEQNTRRWWRDRLREGRHQPFWRLGLVDRAVLVGCASLLRRSCLPLDRLCDQAGVYWDLYLVYLMASAGQAAYYCPQRLARYRAHADSETAVSGSRDAHAKVRKGRAGMFCHGTFMADPRLAACRDYFRRQHADYATTLGVGLMRLGRPSEARGLLWRSLCSQRRLRTMAALLLSCVPARYRQRRGSDGNGPVASGRTVS